MLTLILEALTVCFILLLFCAVGIANGPENMAFFYEQEVQDRAVEQGLITREKLKRNRTLFLIFGVGGYVVFLFLSVYVFNGARGFLEPFKQMLFIVLVEGAFDRFFIDWFWVGHTKAWTIPGTEDLKPYIAGKALAMKWVNTLVTTPAAAAFCAFLFSLVIK